MTNPNRKKLLNAWAQAVNDAKDKDAADKRAAGFLPTADGWKTQADLDARKADLDAQLAALLPKLNLDL